MKEGHRITLDIPDEIFSELTHFKQKTRIADIEAAVFELLKYALSVPPYFKNFDWDRAEKEADADIASGNIKEFSSVEDFLADLKS